jgi:dTDP-4-amino-4,6-dideoxygalactose transaminase
MSYKVRFVNYPEHYKRLWTEIMPAIEGCLSRGDLIARQQLDDFEANFAKYVGTKHAIGLNSGTDALLISVKAAGIGKGDEVVTVSHTFVATIMSIVFNGATPKLVDVGQDMEMDVSKLEKAITKKTKAIIPVHLNGRMADMRIINEIAEERSLVVIEDAAQALGAKVGKYRSGASGLAGCFSFYPAKVLGAAGDGGALTTNDDELAKKVRLLRDHGFKRDTNELLMYGFNSRLDNIQAALLDIKLRHLDDWIERRRGIAAMYEKGMKGVPGLMLPPGPKDKNGFFDVYQNYVVRTPKRDALYQFLKEQGIETIISWPKPTHSHPALGLTKFSLPVTEELSRTVISLPLFPELADDEAQYVIDKVLEFFGKGK